MNREEAIEYLKHADTTVGKKIKTRTAEALDMAIKALQQQPCEDAISRQAAISVVEKWFKKIGLNPDICIDGLISLPPVTPQPKMERCKDCKHFEYNSVAKVNGIPLIVAHEICNRWGDGCKTKEDGYCFLFEPKMPEAEK